MGSLNDEHSKEQDFLKNYDFSQYERPSVTADIAAFTIKTENSDNYRRDDIRKLALLLVKRAEFPFKNQWALPGGFVRADETIEECAFRKTLSKTGINPVSIMPVGTFSKPSRDPRGRVISNAFVSVITGDTQNIHGDDNTADVKWFDVFFEKSDDDIINLSLKHSDIHLKAVLKETSNKFGFPEYHIIDSGTLAFDHAAIIAAALTALRNCIGNFEFALDFLPPKFTLSELQCVQETVLNVSMLTANFRRKAANYVEETGEYITGAGHRPAMLYKRKNTRR